MFGVGQDRKVLLIAARPAYVFRGTSSFPFHAEGILLSCFPRWVALEHDLVSMTPLRLDLTDEECLKQQREKAKEAARA